MLNAEIAWENSFEDVKGISFSNLQECEADLHKWARENDFSLMKDTGAKNYALYLKCSLSGKPRKDPKAEGKRKKV